MPSTTTTAYTPTFSPLSLSASSARQVTSQISKVYRQASTLFLTRRLPESLSTLLPVITTSKNGDSSGEPKSLDSPPLIASANKSTRVKVWSLYLTILNAICELAPDEGKHAFGYSEFRSLVSKVRDGDIWEEVVRDGYGGIEGNVDSDVVINLATLLLAHARSQKLNQTRLETYLAASTTPNFENLQSPAHSHIRAHSLSSANGTDTPRDLNARVKILELYTLHVLLRNDEWDYAQEFITNSSVLDEERREAFLQALLSLQEEQIEVERRALRERKYHEEKLKREAEAARKNQEREQWRRKEEERARRETGSLGGSEVDYGVEDTLASRAGLSRSSATSQSSAKKNAQSSTTASNKLPPRLIHRAGSIVGNFKKIIESMAGNSKTQPLIVMRILALIVALVAIWSRGNVKEMLRRAWQKVMQTAAMGGKVSYI